jgi:hypothetical protein
MRSKPGDAHPVRHPVAADRRLDGGAPRSVSDKQELGFAGSHQRCRLDERLHALLFGQSAHVEDTGTPRRRKGVPLSLRKRSRAHPRRDHMNAAVEAAAAADARSKPWRQRDYDLGSSADRRLDARADRRQDPATDTAAREGMPEAAVHRHHQRDPGSPRSGKRDRQDRQVLARVRVDEIDATRQPPGGDRGGAAVELA